jgi:hypothetical protein
MAWRTFRVDASYPKRAQILLFVPGGHDGAGPLREIPQCFTAQPNSHASLGVAGRASRMSSGRVVIGKWVVPWHVVSFLFEQRRALREHST